ncbi:MAG: chromosomal replication initiator protein DnaA [Phycisphaerales bacterium]|nr:MAG: chromosomal replication initiator protein DnaA [Phycisphaerales bacterium]
MANPDLEIWAGMRAHLRGEHPSICRQWFDEIEPLGINAGVLHLRTATDVQRNYLMRQGQEAFDDAARAVSKYFLSVRFLGPHDEPEPIRGSVVPAARRAVGLDLHPDNGFENFVSGPGNRLAHAASVAVAGNPGKAYNPLFIHGGVGLGKTHLLQAICLQIAAERPDAVVYYTSCDDFLNQFMEAVQRGQMADFRHRFRDVDVLVIDDIHFLASRERSQEEFFHTFNALYQADKQLVLSSDERPEEIPQLEQRLVSRCQWGLVAEVEPPCFETRVAILKKKAKLRGLELPDDVAAHIAALIDTNIRELEGAITKVQVVAMIEGVPIDLALARKALGERVEVRVASGPSIPQIIEAVTDYYQVKTTDLQGRRRHRSVALPRQVCMYLAREQTLYSLEEIGGFFGGRDHTTVMHAIKTVKSKRLLDPELDALLRSLEQQLRTAPKPA